MGLISRVSSRTYRSFLGSLSLSQKTSTSMADQIPDDNDLLDYDDDEQTQKISEKAGDKKDVKGTYVSVHGAGFRDFPFEARASQGDSRLRFRAPFRGPE